MDSEQRSARFPGRWPIPFVVLVGALVLVAVPRFVTPKEVSPEMAFDRAARQGIVLASSNLKVGTEIFQWDPELDGFPPFRLGAVSDPNVPFRKRHLVRITSTNRLLNGTCLDIDPRQLRYWVRR